MSKRALAAVGLVVALLAQAVGLLGPTTSARSATSWLPGIDVSHWNGAINWASVATGGWKFAIAKATDGTTYVDPTFATNKAGAMSNGVKFSAYHFARPSSTSGDAVTQADHFVDTAQLTAGNLIPALDLEITGGLGVTALQTWTMGWLNEVTERLGVRPMIYTGNSFWQMAMGDTQMFADAGYKTLWIAHWNVAAPSVPANNWGGRGWTFWQWTDCQTVSGISGCVDGDRYNGLDLTPVTIPKLSVTKTANGSVASTPGGIDCGANCQSIYDPGSQVALSASPEPGAVFVKWGGACAGSTSCSVTMMGNKSVTASFGFVLSVSKSGTGTGTVTSSPAGLSCGSSCQAPFVTGSSVTLTPVNGTYSAFTGWSGACSGSATTCTVTMSAAKSVTASFIDLRLPRVTISPPTTITGPATATFTEAVKPVTAENFVVTLAGGSTPIPGTIRCWGAGGVAVNCSTGNVLKTTLTPSSALVAGQYYTVLVDPVTAGSNVSDLDGNPVDASTRAFRGATLQQENSRAVRYGWATVANPNTYNGSYTVERLAWAKATYRFTGTSITWYTLTAPSQGLALVYIDNVLKGSFNQFASSVHYHVPRTFSGLASGPHTLQIVPRGLKGSSSGTNTLVSIDAFKVGTTLDGTPDAVYSWRRASSSSASGGAYAVSDLNGATASFTFRGTGVDWYTMVGPDQGKAQIWVDGVWKATVDNYAASRAFNVRRSIRYLADALHTLQIRVLGQRRTASTGRFVVVDRFVAI
jgi:GH25 family lysozyme M1 (1,4-beta-N-acetylmuramidase)